MIIDSRTCFVPEPSATKNEATKTVIRAVLNQGDNELEGAMGSNWIQADRSP